jgi:hypothetical protein
VDFWDDGVRKAVRALIPEVEGKPVVHTGSYDGGVYVCRRISGLHTDEDSFNGECEWVDPEDARPGELTDGMSISCDCVRLGPGWWQDMYFGWYFVYDPALVTRSLAGDHSWVKPFLDSMPLPPQPPAPDLRGRAHRLLPAPGRPFLRTEEVVKRLRGQFSFFAASPHQSPGALGVLIAKLIRENAPPAAMDAAVAGRDCTFSVVRSNDAESMDYLNFEVRPGDGILVTYRDEQHLVAVSSLLERCARLLEYDIVSQ